MKLLDGREVTEDTYGLLFYIWTLGAYWVSIDSSSDYIDVFFQPPEMRNIPLADWRKGKTQQGVVEYKANQIQQFIYTPDEYDLIALFGEE